jgi:hypothetical protein
MMRRWEDVRRGLFAGREPAIGAIQDQLSAQARDGVNAEIRAMEAQFSEEPPHGHPGNPG